MPRAGLPDVAPGKILRQRGAGKARRVGKAALRIVESPGEVISDRTDGHRVASGSDSDSIEVIEVDGAGNGASNAIAASHWKGGTRLQAGGTKRARLGGPFSPKRAIAQGRRRRSEAPASNARATSVKLPGSGISCCCGGGGGGVSPPDWAS